MKLDLLAFGAHPDDVEIGMGATLAKYAKEGYKVGICDLTRAELSSNGTPQIRQQEASKAGEILNLTTRIQLDFPDRNLKRVNDDQLAHLVTIIRKYKPTIIFSPYEVDRHPDHGACTEIIREAMFNAGIHRYECKEKLPAYRPESLYHYYINSYSQPDFLIDVSKYMEQKKEALLAYESQFIKSATSVDTPLTNGYISIVEAREQLFGKDIGVNYAEGFTTNKPLVITNLLAGKGG